MVKFIYLILELIILINSFNFGYLSYYDDGVMKATVDIRQEWGQLPEDLSDYDGFVATLECEHIGETFHMFTYKGYYKLLVSDCAVRDDSDGTRTWMINNKIAGEINYSLSQEIDRSYPVYYFID